MAGHEVVFASQPGLLEEIQRTGHTGVEVGTDVDTVGMVREYLRPSPEPSKGPRALRMLFAHADAMVDDLAAFTREWGADLIVYDQTTLAAPIAAAAAGVPAVRQLYGTDLLVRARGLLPDLLAPLAERHGVRTFDPFGDVTVDPVPADLQVDGGYRRVPMRYTPFNGAGVMPGPRPTSNGRRRVCVSWGHTIAKVDPRRFIVGRILAAIEELDIDVDLAISAAQRDLLDPVPPTVRVLVDVSLDHVLDGCDLLVGHGGAGSVLTAIGRGVPMLLIPQLPDHAGHAARVAGCGAGIVLRAEESTSRRIRAQVERLLAGDAERTAARALRDRMRAQASPATVVAMLESIR